MKNSYEKKYKIAGEDHKVKPGHIVNDMIKVASCKIPGYPQGRKFSDGAFNIIFAAIVREIEKIEQETRQNRDDLRILTSL